MTIIRTCDKEKLRGFLSNQLELDDRLEFLLHLDRCAACWNELYSATKAEHPHYYQTGSKRTKAVKKLLGSVRPKRQVEEEEAVFA